MSNVIQTCDERERGQEGREFIVYFLDNDEDQSVHVEEGHEVDLSKVIRYLNSGGSVFITHRRRAESTTGLKGDVSRK